MMTSQNQHVRNRIFQTGRREIDMSFERASQTPKYSDQKVLATVSRAPEEAREIAIEEQMLKRDIVGHADRRDNRTQRVRVI